MKKHLLFVILILLFAFGAMGCGSNTPPAAENTTEAENAGLKENPSEEPVKVRMAIDTAAGGSFQIRVAKNKGYFEKYGIDAELSNFAYGIDTVNALLVNQSDTALAADYALVNSLGKGDMVVVSSLTRTNEKSAEKTLLFVQNEINSSEDLVGKKLGVQKGTVYEYVWAKYLEKNNIDIEDITYVPFSTPDEAIVSLQNGDMDAVWIGGALTSKFKELEGVKSLGNVLDAGVNISAYLLIDKSFAQQNPETVASVIKAINDGIDYIPGHEEETAKIAFQELKLPEESVLDDLKYTNYDLGFSQEDYDHLQDIKTWSEEHGILTDSYELKDKIYTRPLENSFPDRLTYTP